MQQWPSRGTGISSIDDDACLLRATTTICPPFSPWGPEAAGLPGDLLSRSMVYTHLLDDDGESSKRVVQEKKRSSSSIHTTMYIHIIQEEQ
mmetsp:Transcript_30020/g.48859  ORF Transcript_30020/g.48859 Transcript_30020/m.48859 type:complete len:91 (-) Transcript_30020:150-422(-)